MEHEVGAHILIELNADEFWGTPRAEGLGPPPKLRSHQDK